MKQQQHKPSRLVVAFFHWFCHPDYREEIEGDLMERFSVYFEKYGYNKANRLFVKEVIFLFRPSIIGNIYHLTHTDTMEITNQNKRLVAILATAIAVLLVPFIAMNFTNDVNWKIFDFLVAGVLLIGTGLTLEFILRKIKTLRFRILFGIALFLVLMLIWVELAVGIFGTVIAGS
ncbi:permease prefix domain 2-containing transporter [uncultured Polaribacter sp.]|uniref:permease prefix domain 2-containing transporter n=1 Tax=uncultured Polaribacter sp. TaxID=174711 RepID=UPI0026371B26|nr:permease prefix domain 2-containing transporter [uncultured Polaribacter sp.]